MKLIEYWRCNKKGEICKKHIDRNYSVQCIEKNTRTSMTCRIKQIILTHAIIFPISGIIFRAKKYLKKKMANQIPNFVDKTNLQRCQQTTLTKIQKWKKSTLPPKRERERERENLESSQVKGI